MSTVCVHRPTCRAYMFLDMPPWSCAFLVLVADSHDVCMHEVFNASCRQGAVILMVLAVYGRMRIGRCINGDFNIGCSKDVLSYFDAQCSTRQSCDVSIRNLVEIHPCQRDFTSYLQASYKCIEGKAVQRLIGVRRTITMSPASKAISKFDLDGHSALTFEKIKSSPVENNDILTKTVE